MSIPFEALLAAAFPGRAPGSRAELLTGAESRDPGDAPAWPGADSGLVIDASPSPAREPGRVARDARSQGRFGVGPGERQRARGGRDG